MAYRTGGGRYRPQPSWPGVAGQAGESTGTAKHQGEVSMTRSWFASAALARCSLEIDSLAYRGLPLPPADQAGRSAGQDPTSRPAAGGGA
jgi:hypothetical protein